MAISSLMILRTSRTVLNHAIRAVATSNILTGYNHVTKALAANQQHGPVRRPGQYFSTSAGLHKLADDQETIKFVRSEIKSTKANNDTTQMPQAPENFPFEIKDTPCEESIILTRELGGEKIKVEVAGPYCAGSDDDDDSSSTDTSDDSDGNVDDKSSTIDTSSEEDEQEVPEKRELDSYEPFIRLTVEISKENGKVLKLVARANNGSIRVQDLTVDNYNSHYCPRCWMFGKEGLQDTWRNYLARRGIEDGIVDFLTEYMEKKPSRYHMAFLKNLKKFIKD